MILSPHWTKPCSHAVRPLTPCSKHHGHQNREWSWRCQSQHQEEKWNIGAGCTFGWWDDGPQGRHQSPAAPESCVHFITGLSYNKPTESFSPQRSARINCSSFNSRIAHGLSAIIALFRWLFQVFIYFTLGGITGLSLFRFGPGFPSLVIPNCTQGGSGLFSTFYDLLVLLHFWILNVCRTIILLKQQRAGC